VGWNLTNGKPTFPNARYLIPQKDWDYWTEPSVLANAEHIANQVVPLNEMNIMDLIGDDYRITDELTTVATPGHTPGHVSILINSQGDRGYILGDVAHSPAQAHYTDWSPIFDVDPQLSRQTRHTVLDLLEKEGILVSAGHFPDPGFGRFVRGESRRYWQAI
ncbi:MAG: MBL fold metallo-hydrolase, partial [Dehalococcoidia bacterium]